MNQDPVETRLRESSWRRKLTDAERAELRAWLATHPEAQAEWEAESALSETLAGLPDAPVPSNFTARVLQAVERETRADERAAPPRRTWWWHSFVPRAAVAVAVLGFAVFGYQRYEITQHVIAAKRIVAVTASNPVPSQEELENFEAIRRLQTLPAADEELLALMQ